MYSALRTEGYEAAVAHHTFSMEQVQSCTIIYLYVFHLTILQVLTLRK